jgi:copper chaperone CopZ
MKILTFTTNINCGNCIKSVTPWLNQSDEIEEWNVDTNNPQKVLTAVVKDSTTPETIIDIVTKAGFDIQAL